MDEKRKMLKILTALPLCFVLFGCDTLKPFSTEDFGDLVKGVCSASFPLDLDDAVKTIAENKNEGGCSVTITKHQCSVSCGGKNTPKN